MNERILIGIDVGGTNCRGAVVGLYGRTGELQRKETLARAPEPFVDQLVQFVNELMISAEGKPVHGVGLGVPGIISPAGAILESPNLRFLDGFPLRETLSDRLELPVSMVNDVNAICWGEALYGAGRDMHSFIVVALGTGVGGGLVLDRQLWLGVDGAAGEIGHMPVEAAGRLCGCGANGCLEQYASASGIVKSIIEMRSSGQKSSLDPIAVDDLTTHDIAAAARKGDMPAKKAFDSAGARLGQVLAGVINLLNLDGIIISGGVSASFDLLEPALRTEVRNRCFERSLKSVQIKRGELGDKAGIIGAALLSLQH
ncbi:MAG: ROK family protein [Desulfuromonadales bacterium]